MRLHVTRLPFVLPFFVLPFFAVIWDALKAATEAETALAQAIVDGAGIIVTSDDLSCCYDERGEGEGRVGGELSEGG